jgi:hypothetical protein
VGAADGGAASVVLPDGRVRQVPLPVTATELMLKAPGHFLTDAAGVVAASARPTVASPQMHSADPVAALSEAASARTVVGAAVTEGCSWLGGGGGSGAHSAGGGAGGSDVEELDAEGLGHAARG